MAISFTVTPDFPVAFSVWTIRSFKGNHVNALGVTNLPPDSILDAAYDRFYAWASTNAQFIQFNHPNSWQGESPHNLIVGNFGQNLYSDTNSFVTGVGAITRTIAILNSVQGGHI